MNSAPKPRPKYYDISLAHLPLPGIVSIFHRVSGVLLFFPIVPLLLFALQSALGSEAGYAQWQELLASPAARLALLGVVWLYAHHFWAGLRYLLLDLHYGVALAPARKSAATVFVLGLATTVIVGVWLW